MGQYHLTVNLDKREFISPHKLGAGLKLWEQLANEIGPGKALVVLLAHPDQRGGGDFDVDQNWHGPERKDMTRVGPMPEEYPAIAKRTIGRWRGDRIAIIGDYAEDNDIPNMRETDPPISTIYGLCHEPDPEDENPPANPFKDVTDDVIKVIEHELNGAFMGNGWSRWVQVESEVFRWEKETQIKGKVIAITPTTVTVKWPRAETQYPRDGSKPSFF